MNRSSAGGGDGFPLVTFVIPVSGVQVQEPMPILSSLYAQDSSDWDAVVVRTAIPSLKQMLGERVAEVRVEVGATLAKAMNHGLEKARGRFVAFLSSDDRLQPNAISVLASVLAEDSDVAFTDEIVNGEVFSKPAFSPERLRGQFYLRNLTVYRRTLVGELGGIRSGVDGAEVYDLALRSTRGSRRVEHAATPVFTGGDRPLASLWGTTESDALRATKQVLDEHLKATGGGTVDAVSESGIHHTRRAVLGEPLVSIVIPTRGGSAVVRGEQRNMVIEVVRSIVDRSTYGNYEIVVVIDEVAEKSTRQELARLGGSRLRFVEWTRPFNFSEKINTGVLHARGEYVLLLNDDTEVITPGWIEPMLALAQLPRAALVGSMLYFEDDTIQHAGHAYYRRDVTHIGMHSERGASGPWGAFLLEREVQGVTCACALVRKSVFLEAGGLSTLLPGNFNDVDLSMKMASLGYQSYWTPYSELYHFESKSRNPRVAKFEIDTAWGRWEHLLWDSPFWPTDPHEVFKADQEP